MATVEWPASSVLAEMRGAVRVVTLNRPRKLNAVDLEMEQRLLDELQAVQTDRRVRVVVITGAGRAFSSGGDRALLEQLAAGALTDKQELGRVQLKTIRCILGLPVPVIAAVNGPAVGVAAGIVAVCDIVIMGQDAFLCDPHVTFGIGATFGCQLMWPHLTSRIVAKEILMSGRRVPAEEAVNIGLANRVCPSGAELETALEMAETFVALPQAGVAASKQALNQRLLEEARLTDGSGPPS
jgi:enoyl-CoA hydratase/carnithine racemase